jgi:hypothetical protein
MSEVDGQPCTLTKYRVSANYQTAGQRIQYTCTRPNGQTYSNIEVVSGQYAWNEDIVGAEIISGKGKATPMPAAIKVTAQAPAWIQVSAAPQTAQNQPTPRLADGKPDLTELDSCRWPKWALREPPMRSDAGRLHSANQSDGRL